MTLTFVLNHYWLTATVLEGLFGEYHSSSATLGKQRPEVTRQPLVCDWLATSEALYDVKSSLESKYKGKLVQGVNIMTMKDLARLPLCCHVLHLSDPTNYYRCLWIVNHSVLRHFASLIMNFVTSK